MPESNAIFERVIVTEIAASPRLNTAAARGEEALASFLTNVVMVRL